MVPASDTVTFMNLGGREGGREGGRGWCLGVGGGGGDGLRPLGEVIGREGEGMRGDGEGGLRQTW